MLRITTLALVFMTTFDLSADYRSTQYCQTFFGGASLAASLGACGFLTKGAYHALRSKAMNNTNKTSDQKFDEYQRETNYHTVEGHTFLNLGCCFTGAAVITGMAYLGFAFADSMVAVAARSLARSTP